MKNMVFTVCSINYLGQALTLGDSLKDTNPEYQFVIILVDKIEDRKEKLANIKHKIIEIHNIPVHDFEGMCERYAIVELNTAVKPYVAEWLYNENPEVENLTYLDPDIMVFNKLKPLEDLLEDYNLVLTPHMTSSPNGKLDVDEYLVLRSGEYNLGFLGTKRSEETIRFLKWWQEKLLFECVFDRLRVINVDQGWVALAPCYFDDVYVWRHRGCNMAYWNIHDRLISSKNGVFYVNEKQPILFYHFSAYKPDHPERVRVNSTKITFENRPDLVEIYDVYREKLLANSYLEFRKEPNGYNMPKSFTKHDFRQRFKNKLVHIIDRKI